MTRILVLEDDAELRETLEAVLSCEGYEVVCASGGEEAIRAASESEFDLIVTDIRMPGMDGLQALEEMRKHCGPVESLVVTGYSTEEDSIRAIRLGAGDYLTKPFKLEDFLASVESLLARRREVARRREEERSLRHSLLWAMGLVATPAQKAAQERARNLCAALGLDAEANESIQLAVLMSGVSFLAGEFGPSVPPRVMHILENLEERWDGSGAPLGLEGAAIPLEARVAAVALAQHDGLDPSLVAMLQQPSAAADAPAAMSDAQARGLVSLARALEEAGSLANARDAFDRVARDAARSREKLDALHGLARLASGRQAEDHLERALEMADSLGPMSSASSHLQAGLQFMDRDPARARALLRRSAELYRGLAMRGSQARAWLALAATGEEVAVETLEAAAQELSGQSGLTDVVDWLLPFLLSRGGFPTLLRRLLRSAPRATYRLLQQERLDREQRVRLVESLSQVTGNGAQALLKVLSADADPAVRQGALKALSLEPVVEAPSPVLLRLYCLGPLEAYWGEDRIPESDWKSRKVKQLFAMLAAQRGRPVSEDRLVETFWPDDLDRGKKNLNWTLSVLRRAVGSEVVARNVGGVSLNPSLPRWHDLEQVEDLAAAASSELRSAGRLERAERFHHLLELYRGPYLEECYLDWALEIRSRLETTLVPVLLGCAQHFAEKQQHQEALEFLNCLMQLDPFHQDGCRLSMQSYLALRRPEQAVKQFKSFRDRLHRELGMEPTIELLEAHQRALLQM